MLYSQEQVFHVDLHHRFKKWVSLQVYVICYLRRWTGQPNGQLLDFIMKGIEFYIMASVSVSY